ncbi:hypothetical protein PpBr36_07016 [Pyricularia pennisetigena]|uniref:hypothetical protein n=1 Tax=Pyricularia pennisetigena TaxID=1578925 RepID=UPI00114E1798|nr:hypothetical protein PpBr36_07016 [Pyricularia pennisetigena]TLS25096.1 hypothetical protein PpBr36_07016 [Pyricularia pennisetigena]
MSRSAINLMRVARRGVLQNATIAQRAPLLSTAVPTLRKVNIGPAKLYRSVATATASRRKGIQPESETPEPTDPDESAYVPKTPAPLEESEYHDLADEYLDNVLSKLEDVAEQRPDVDVEYSSGVLTLAFPPLGTYVINKQPPNKQIWLSSPVSGPKRYDYVIIGDGQNQKEGTGLGDWVYLRDGSTLSGLLMEELNVDVITP